MRNQTIAPPYPVGAKWQWEENVESQKAKVDCLKFEISTLDSDVFELKSEI